MTKLVILHSLEISSKRIMIHPLENVTDSVTEDNVKMTNLGV